MPGHVGRAICAALALGGLAGLPTAAAHAQGIDINDLLRGGSGKPEEQAPAPQPGLAVTAGAEPVDAPLPAAPPVAAFPETALAGAWTGIGADCAHMLIRFKATDDGFPGTLERRNARTGGQEVTGLTARHDRPWQGPPHPFDDTKFFAYARQYTAQFTPGAAGGTDGPADGWTLTLLLSRDAGSGGLVLRFAEPVTVCSFARRDG